jgi:hypothetical protein
MRKDGGSENAASAPADRTSISLRLIEFVIGGVVPPESISSLSPHFRNPENDFENRQSRYRSGSTASDRDVVVEHHPRCRAA